MLHGLNDNNSAGREFIRGLCSALPIALGYLPVAVAFAVISRTQGIPDFFIVAMSLLVFAGASQFAAAGMWGGGGSVGAIVLATFVLNLRHLLFSASLSRRLEKDVSRGWAALLSFGVTDECFAAAVLQKGSLSRYFLLGLEFLAYFAWVAGTGLGLLLSGQMPGILQNSLGIALYALFIGLLVPALRNSRPAILVAVLALVSGALLFWLPQLSAVPAGWKVVISTLAAAGIGAWCCPEEASEL